jgi:hypothetical protein
MTGRLQPHGSCAYGQPQAWPSSDQARADPAAALAQPPRPHARGECAATLIRERRNSATQLLSARVPACQVPLDARHCHRQQSARLRPALRPPSDKQGSGPLRASDADREQTLEALAAAGAEGRLSLEEYSQRSEAALVARTLGELTGLTADLPALPQSDPALAPAEITAVLSNG